MHTLDDTVAS